VVDYGLAGTGATLCARYLPFPSWIITNADHIWEIGLFALYVYPDTDVSPYVASTGFGLPHTNFPYGIAVEPNVPL
jgi:hypothetical protein